MVEALAGRRVCIHVGGGVAAFKAASLITDLRRGGAEVRVVMTPNATRFITPLTLQGLSGHTVITDLWGGDVGTGPGAGPVTGPEDAGDGMPHLSLSGWCDVQVVIAATANLIARLAHGFSDDAVTTTALACRAPMLIAPAMETSMWEHPATQANVAILSGRGVTMVGPVEGRQASGRLGSGRMAEV
ncbi:MAG: flavoprotein, partial [Candidatus Dormibacteria bacterium]